MKSIHLLAVMAALSACTASEQSHSNSCSDLNSSGRCGETTKLEREIDAVHANKSDAQRNRQRAEKAAARAEGRTYEHAHPRLNGVF